MTRRAVVTGGAGVIGRELVELLAAQGVDVLSIDRLPLEARPAGVTHLEADLSVTDLRPIADFRPSWLFHLAATFERTAESPDFWDQNWTDNVVVTHRLAELAPDLPELEAFVFASSYLVYRPESYLYPDPPGDAAALTEDEPTRPRNLCGAAKLYGEAELEFLRDVLGTRFRTTAARIFRVYGRGSRDVVSRWIRSALRDEPIELYHGENRFDYVFSRDVAEGLLRIAEQPLASGPLNVATGSARQVREVLATIEAATGRRLDVREVQRPGEPFEASRADLSRLRSVVGWAPATSLEDGVARVVEHERSAVPVG